MNEEDKGLKEKVKMDYENALQIYEKLYKNDELENEAILPVIYKPR
jgi:hypothetical protein